MGRNGAGKTTLIKSLLNNYPGRADKEFKLVLTCNSGRYIVKFMVKGESFAQDSADAGVFSE